jgi:hypothetical protein
MKHHHHRLHKRGRHFTACKTLRRRLVWLEARPEVQRIVLDVAVACRHQRTPGTLDVVAVVPGGVKLKAYDARGVRLVFVKTSVPQSLVQVLAFRRDSA